MASIGLFGSTFGPMTALRTFNQNRLELNGSLERLSTGYRINRGSDDPAGLITSERLRAVLASLDAESRVLQRADHVAATADGALGEISDMLVEAESLVVANANTAGISDEERAANQLQIDAIMSEVNRIASTTSFNGDSLLDGTATLTAGGTTVSIDSMTVGPIGEGEDALAALADARDKVSAARGELGSFSRYTVGSQLNRIGIAMENVAAAESVIRNTDYGLEMANLTRLELMSRSNLMAMSMTLAQQANVLDLLGPPTR
jgi:flagellin